MSLFPYMLLLFCPHSLDDGAGKTDCRAEAKAALTPAAEGWRSEYPLPAAYWAEAACPACSGLGWAANRPRGPNAESAVVQVTAKSSRHRPPIGPFALALLSMSELF
jgi:hypothetical protein